MSAQFTEEVTLTTIQCGECGITFAVPETWRRDKKESGDGWFCPNGHPRVYRESDVAVLKKQLEAERAHSTHLRDQRDAEARGRKSAERQAAAQKGQATRLRKRAAAGVCPCCHRTVSQLAEHMKTKHPDYVRAAAEVS